MPVADLFASSRRILRHVMGRSCRTAWMAAIVPLGGLAAKHSQAAPGVTGLPSKFPATPFSLRITDMERVPGDAEGDAFRIEMQALNWTVDTLDALMMSVNVGTSAVEGGAPRISGASIDSDGRGGLRGGNDIGPGVADAISMHSGWGRPLSPFSQNNEYLNDWNVSAHSPSFVHWDNYDLSIPRYPFDAHRVAQRPLLSPGAPLTLVPGFGLDALGDSAIDGGPSPYAPSSPGGGEPDNYNGYYSNVLDGFVLDVDDWDEGEVFSLNWFMANVSFSSSGLDHRVNEIGSAGGGDPFGFGVMSLVRITPSIGAPAGSLPGPVFVDNAGFDQSNFSFYDTVYEIPNPAEFAAEFGGAITAPFVNPADNVFGMPINTALIPEPSGGILMAGAVACCSFAIRRLIVPQ